MKNAIIIALIFGSFTLKITATSLERTQSLWQQSLEKETAGNYASAIKHTVEYAKSGGDRYLGTLRLGYLYQLNKDYTNALKFYTIAARSSTGSISPLLGLANTYNAQTNYSKAKKVAKSALTLDRNNYTALMLIASIDYNQKNYKSALAYYSRVNKRYPEDQAALSGLAWSNLCCNNLRAAKQQFKKLLEISPNYAYASKGYKLSQQTKKR